MGLISKPNTFSAGATIVASEHNDNFDTVYNLVNGNIDNDNIDSSASIVATKLNLSTIAQSITFTGNNTFAGTTIADLGTITTVDINGGTISADSLDFVAGGANVTIVNDEDDMVTDSATALATQQSIKAYVDSTALSNVIFCWHGCDSTETTTNTHVLYRGTNIVPGINSETATYFFHGTYGSTYKTIRISRYLHQYTFSTVRIYARLWSSNAGSSSEAYLKVDIGGVNGEAHSTTSTTPAWYLGTVDVSSLTVGTTYTVTIQLKNENATENAYCSAILLILA